MSVQGIFTTASQLLSNCTQYVLPEVEVTDCADSLCTVLLAILINHAVEVVAVHGNAELVIYPASLLKDETLVGTVGTAHQSLSNLPVVQSNNARCQSVLEAGHTTSPLPHQLSLSHQ